MVRFYSNIWFQEPLKKAFRLVGVTFNRLSFSLSWHLSGSFPAAHQLKQLFHR